LYWLIEGFSNRWTTQTHKTKEINREREREEEINKEGENKIIPKEFKNNFIAHFELYGREM
jgi:hypothetical protein